MTKIKTVSLFTGYFALSVLSAAAGYTVLMHSLNLRFIINTSYLAGLIAYPALFDLLDEKAQKSLLLPNLFNVGFVALVLVVLLVARQPLIVGLSFLGLYVAGLGCSKKMRERYKTGTEFLWTLGHVVGIGVLPFAYGAGIANSELGAAAHTSSEILSLKIITMIGLVWMLVHQIASYKWTEEHLERIGMGRECDNARLESFFRAKGTGSSDKEVTLYNIRQQLRLRYMLMLFLLALTIPSLLLTARLNVAFIVAGGLSFLILTISYFDYPRLIVTRLGVNLGRTIRVIVLFMLLVSMIVDAVALNDVRITEALFNRMSAVLTLLAGGVTISIVFLMLQLQSESLADYPPFYERRLRYVAWTTAIFSAFSLTFFGMRTGLRPVGITLDMDYLRTIVMAYSICALIVALTMSISVVLWRIRARLGWLWLQKRGLWEKAKESTQP